MAESLILSHDTTCLICLIYNVNTSFYKFIHNTVERYVHMYTKLHTCTIHKHTYQDQCRIKHLHKYRYKLHHFTS